jgi:glc operon protein GlcG
MFMTKALSKCVVACAAMMLSAAAYAQQPAAPATPPPPPPQYGLELSADMARKAIAAAEAEAKKNNWFMNVAVVGPSGHLLAFSRMDGAQYASIAIAQHKARAAATFRRPTKVFQDGLAANPANVYLLSLDDVIASEGGIPIIADGKLVGAIGCSGGTGQQDGLACQAGVNALK